MTSHLWLTNLSVTAVSIVVLSILLFVYARNARAVRSPFSIGLVLFGALILVSNLVFVAMTVTMMTSGIQYPPAIPWSMLGLNVAELAGFGVLLRISWQ